MFKAPSVRGKSVITVQEWLAICWETAHRFQVNLWNFETQTGKMGVEVWQESFKLRRFNSQGTPQWPLSKYKNGGGHYRGTLIDTGNLQKSIHYMIRKGRKGNDNISWRPNPRHGLEKGEKIDPNQKREWNSIFYAGVHNDGPGAVATYQVRHNKRNAKKGVRLEGAPRRIPQRQFMPSKWSSTPDSTVFNDKLQVLEARLLFNGIPATRIR